MKSKTIFLFVIGLLMLVITYYLFPSLPEKIPTHWNSSGIADNYQDKVHIYAPIALYTVSFGLVPVCRLLDPKKKNYDKSKSALNTIQLIFSFMFLVIWIVTLYAGFHPQEINMNMVMFPLMGMFLTIFGNAMPKVKANYFIGIRTPWTLASEDVWYRTHRLGGKIWFFGGIIFMLGGFLIPTSMIAFFIPASLMLIAGIPIVYSYFCFKNLFKEPSSSHKD